MRSADVGSRTRLVAISLALALHAAVAAAQPKELHWRALEVAARLDDAGKLHVVERQAMVFTGDWNGGQRVFRVLPGQSLALEGVSRVDPSSGERHELAQGDLSEVDRFAWTDGHALRWRSRRPSDDPFRNTEIDYEIRYTLSGILVKQGSAYLLDHDFAFPDREGDIERFELELTLDPSWESDSPIAPKFVAGPLPPGRGFVLTRRLTHHGGAAPVAGTTGSTRAARTGVFAALLLGVALLFVRFRFSPSEIARWASPPDPASIDRAWLEKNLLTLPPEQAGALWDETVGAPEVAALLARLALEKKIETQAEKKKLSMRLLVPLQRLQGYEHALLAALFFGGRQSTDTDAVSTHYKSSGFDPAEKIRPGIEEALKARSDVADTDLEETQQKPGRSVTLGLFVAAVALLVLSVVTRGATWPDLIGVAIVHAILYGLGLPFAYLFRKRVDRLWLRLFAFIWVPLVFLVFSYQGVRGGDRLSLTFLIGQLLLRLAITSSLFNFARTRNTPRRLARREALAAARAFFARELASPTPRLADNWYPYVLAFGLSHEADRWAREFGVSRETSVVAGGSRSSSTSGSGSASESSPGWTGGGGSFGGAGASASWAAAAGTLAAGVSAPSSGGGGGGGGGGGSSGGGGGGGW